MLNINDLWIGEVVRLKKSGRVGRFEGVRDGKGVINVDGKIVLAAPRLIELYKASDDNKDQPIKTVQEAKYQSEIFQNTIDLHIENLAPSLANSRAERILDIQVQAAQAYIEEAIDRTAHSRTVLIIHGKGIGTLRNEIKHLISLYDEIKIDYLTNNGGATEIIIMK